MWLIQEWREQNLRFTLGPSNQENEEKIEKCKTPKNKQGSDDPIRKKEKDIADQRMTQLKAMVEQQKKLTLLHDEKANEHLKESYPFCTRIRRRTWEGEYIEFSKYNGMSDPRMHIIVFEEAACSHLHDTDMLARLFLRSLEEEAFEWFYDLEDQSITNYE